MPPGRSLRAIIILAGITARTGAHRYGRTPRAEKTDGKYHAAKRVASLFGRVVYGGAMHIVRRLHDSFRQRRM